MYNVLSLNKSAVKAHLKKMDGIAHDLANVNTHGYKRKEVNFEEVRIRQINGEVLKSQNAQDLSLNMGTKAGITKNTFSQGAITPSNEKFNMAISGEGFFGVRDGNGNLMLTRNGSFHQNENGSVSDELGNTLDMDTFLPFDRWTGDIVISKTGEISTLENDERVMLGQVVLYKPDNPHDLISIGESGFVLKNGAGLTTSDGGEGFGDINQYFLEESNAEVSRSMVDMITTQRAYSMNAKALQTTDEIMTMINGIKR
nr:flagellar hook-basal body protein [Tissierella sp.]